MKLLAALVILLALCSCAAFDTEVDRTSYQLVAGSDARVMYRLDPAMACPPGDGYQWRATAQKAKATFYTWTVLSAAQFSRVCNPSGYIDAQGRSFEACAKDRTIYATSPRYTKRESTVQHEECHVLGWEHEMPEQMRMYRLTALPN